MQCALSNNSRLQQLTTDSQEGAWQQQQQLLQDVPDQLLLTSVTWGEHKVQGQQQQQQAASTGQQGTWQSLSVARQVVAIEPDGSCEVDVPPVPNKWQQLRVLVRAAVDEHKAQVAQQAAGQVALLTPVLQEQQQQQQQQQEAAALQGLQPLPASKYVQDL
jgi:hypothetical protein